MFKRFVSLTLFWSAVILFISSIVLFIEPHGRVAFWADWRLLGLSKGKWDDLHICSGALFLLASLVHIYLNWPLIISYLTRKFKAPSSAPVIWGSLALTLFVALGAYFNIPPIKQFLELNEVIKQSYTEEYGNPPFGHAELVPIARLAGFLGIDPEDFSQALRDSGVGVDSAEQCLKDIGQACGMSPSGLFDLAMEKLGKKSGQGRGMLPKIPPPGTGRLTLSDIARTYHIREQVLVSRLKRAGINATAGQSLKEIAASADITAPEVYGILRDDGKGKAVK